MEQNSREFVFAEEFEQEQTALEVEKEIERKKSYQKSVDKQIKTYKSFTIDECKRLARSFVLDLRWVEMEWAYGQSSSSGIRMSGYCNYKLTALESLLGKEEIDKIYKMAFGYEYDLLKTDFYNLSMQVDCSDNPQDATTWNMSKTAKLKYLRQLKKYYKFMAKSMETHSSELEKAIQLCITNLKKVGAS